MAQPRAWKVQPYEDESEEGFRQRAVDALAELETIGHHIGGVFYVRPVRERVAADVFVTTAWHIVWQQFSEPGEARRAMAAMQDDEPVPYEDEDAPPADEPELAPEEPEPVVAS